MQSSGMKQFIDSIKNNARKKSIRKMLMQKRLKGQALEFGSVWTSDQSDKYSEVFIDDLAKLVTLANKRSKVSLLQDHLESVKMQLCEIHQKMEKGMRQAMMSTIMTQNGN